MTVIQLKHPILSDFFPPLAALLRQSAALLEGASAPAARRQGRTHPHVPSTSTRSPGGSPDGPRCPPPADYSMPRHQISTRSSHLLSPGASPSPPQSTSSQRTGSPSAEASMTPDNTIARGIHALSRENLEKHRHASNNLTHSSYRGTEMPEDQRASPQRRPPSANFQDTRGRQDTYRQPSYGSPAGCSSDGDSPSRHKYPRPGSSQIDWRSGYDGARLCEEQEQTSPISRSSKGNNRNGPRETMRKERNHTSPSARSLRQGGTREGREAIPSGRIQSGSNANPSAETSRRGDTTRTRSDEKSDRKSPLSKSPLSESDSRQSTKLYQEHFPEHLAHQHGRRRVEEGIDDSGAGGLGEEGGWSDGDGALAAHEMLRERYARAHRHRGQEFWDDEGLRERYESTRREEVGQDCEDFVDVDMGAKRYLSHQRHRGAEGDSMHARHDDASERGQRQYCDDVQEATDSAGDMLSEDALCHYKSLWVDVDVLPSSTPHQQSANANSSSPRSASSDLHSPCRPRSAQERSERGGSETVWRGNPPLGTKSDAIKSATKQGTSLSVLARESLPSPGALEGAKLPLSSAARLSPPPSQGLPRSTAPRVTSNPDSVKSPKAVSRLSSGAFPAKSHTGADRDSSLSPKSPASASRFTSSFSQKRSNTGDPRTAGSPSSSGRSPPGFTRIAASLSAKVPARSPTHGSSANMSSNRTSPKPHSTSRKSPVHSSFSHRITSSELLSTTHRSADNHSSFSTRTTAWSPPKSAQFSSVNNRTAVSLRARPWASSSNL